MELRSIYKNLKKMSLSSDGNTKKIGLFFIENLDEIDNMSLKQIAKNTDTSEASVTRFCQKMGYDGFIPFRKILHSINENFSFNNYELLVNRELLGDLGTFYEAYLEELGSIQTQLMELIKTPKFQTAGQMIKVAGKIFIGAIGINLNQTIDFKNKLNSIGKICIAEQDTHALGSLANIITKDDLFITISLSNGNEEIMKLGEIAQTNGAKWMHITGRISKQIKFSPDLNIGYDSAENEIWNLYSIRGEGLFQFLNLLFVSIVKTI